MIAGLGGFLNRKSDNKPGCTVMWRGLKRLADLTIGFNLSKSQTKNKGDP